jgi:hypothetical protein
MVRMASYSPDRNEADDDDDDDDDDDELGEGRGVVVIDGL